MRLDLNGEKYRDQLLVFRKVISFTNQIFLLSDIVPFAIIFSAWENWILFLGMQGAELYRVVFSARALQ